ncbi:MAG: hypothetical protein AAF423_06915 [Pseudomonadota bacterium]
MNDKSPVNKDQKNLEKNGNKQSNSSFYIGPGGLNLNGPTWLILILISAIMVVVVYQPTRDAAVCVLTGAQANCERWQGDSANTQSNLDIRDIAKNLRIGANLESLKHQFGPPDKIFDGNNPQYYRDGIAITITENLTSDADTLKSIQGYAISFVNYDQPSLSNNVANINAPYVYGFPDKTFAEIKSHYESKFLIPCYPFAAIGSGGGQFGFVCTPRGLPNASRSTEQELVPDPLVYEYSFTHGDANYKPDTWPGEKRDEIYGAGFSGFEGTIEAWEEDALAIAGDDPSQEEKITKFLTVMGNIRPNVVRAGSAVGG